jgi:endonuclease/exonuclease/phosphatase (EEP) superfamily protein YafD
MSTRADSLLRASVILLGLAAVLSAFGRHDWRLDLLAHWRWHYLAAALILFLFLLVRRSYGTAALATATLLLNAVLFHASATASASLNGPRPGTPLRLANVNVLYRNVEHDRVMAWLDSARPDITVIVEPTQAWLDALAPLERRLPQRIAFPVRDGHGMALYSRYPVNRFRLLRLGETRRVAIVAHLAIGSQDLMLVAAHPLPPRTAFETRERDAYLRDLASVIASAGAPVILAGDLNSTPWSYSFQDLISATGLSARSFPATWPSFLGPFGIPIDHVLAKGAAIQAIQAGPYVGSDHRPVLADLIVPNSP